MNELHRLSPTIQRLEQYLSEFFESYRDMMEESTIDGMEKNSLWKQAKAVFTTMCMLMDLHPDTLDGDMFLSEIYDTAALDGVVNEDDFDLYMWSDLT